MIYFTTLFFTLLLSHVARAMPAACDDVASPEDLYDTTYDTYDTYDTTYDTAYDDKQVYDDEQLIIPTYKVTWDATYDNPNGNTNSVACSNGPHGLAGSFPHFKNFPDFPFLGGAFDVKWGSPHCGKCWKLFNKKTHRSIYLTAIDAAGTGFNIGKHAFIALNGGTVGAGTLHAEAISVPRHHCGL